MCIYIDIYVYISLCIYVTRLLVCIAKIRAARACSGREGPRWLESARAVGNSCALASGSGQAYSEKNDIFL